MPAVLDSAEGIALTTPEGRVEWANRSWAALHGFAMETVGGRQVRELHPAPALEAFLAVVRDRGRHEAELEHLRSDGTRFTSWTSARVVRREDLAAERMVWVVRDRTERDRASEALQELGLRFRSVVQSARDAIVVVDAKRSILLWNAAAERMFGARDSEVVGTAIESLFAEDARERVSAEIGAVLTAPARAASGVLTETTGIDRAGRAFPVEVALSAFTSGRGRFASAIVRDVTERKEAEERIRDALSRAQESDRLKTAFLDNVSHEIRTPVNVIAGMAEVLAEHVRGRGGADADAEEALRALDRAQRRLLDSVGRTLDFAMLSSGETLARPSRVRLRELVEEQVAAYAELAREKGLELATDLPEPDLAIFADRAAVTGALANLIDNAIKFTERGGVRVHAVSGTDGVDLEVEDSGIGISSEFLERLFSPFSQEEAGYDRRYEGQGLGLAVAGRYAEICGGTIAVESEKGRGSRFRLRLPAGPPRRPVSEPRIVVVDRAEREAFWRGRLAGRATLVFLDGVSGLLDRLGEGDERVRALFLDLSMGGAVFPLVRQLRGHPGWWALPMLACASDPGDSSRGRALAAGVDEVLAPADETHVDEALETCLR